MKPTETYLSDQGNIFADLPVSPSPSLVCGMRSRLPIPSFPHPLPSSLSHTHTNNRTDSVGRQSSCRPTPTSRHVSGVQLSIRLSVCRTASPSRPTNHADLRTCTRTSICHANRRLQGNPLRC
ncbi:unnamed protein product [Protopolystoma xenopodis]|uniref:Uncharacterized protein n=1 Tax=Protopolystoma xenopodis TaxID=117903 RepID=A0A3S4ZX89_9PLAT|nr:unnamed protein product [Protopolystoma xenopodis]